MPSLDEAREQALREYFNGDGIGHALDRIHIGKWMWDARGQYDDGVCFLCRWEGQSVGVPGPYNKATEAGPFCERHNAGGQYDEQHIAALVDGLERAMQLIVYGNFKNGNTDPTGSIDEGEVLAGRVYEELRALTGQTGG